MKGHGYRMDLSATQAAKRVGKSIPTITRAIKSGKLTANPRDKGGWVIEASELFRVWPAISNDSAIPLPKLQNETRNETSVLQREVELLREMLGEVKADRDSWREQANRITTLIEDQSDKPKGFWARLMA